MHAGNFGRNAAERPAVGRAGLRVPGFKLARRAAEPEQDAMLLLALGLLGEAGMENSPPKLISDVAPAANALQEQAAMDAYDPRCRR